MLFDLKKKSIIAMKGRPFTQKTEFATLIAASLSCPALSLEHFLDFQGPEYTQTSPPPNHLQPQDLAFEIICRIAKTHLSTGIFDSVVIDSPLSSRSHLDQLIELASSIDLVSSFWQTRIVIVECKPENEYLWETMFLDHIEHNPDRAQKWYKAKNWHDVKDAIVVAYDERLDGYKVSKLVVDPFSMNNQSHEPVSPEQFSGGKVPSRRPYFFKALKYMMTREERDCTDRIVVYDKWRRSQQLPVSVHSSNMRFCKIGHSITTYAEEGLGYEADCMACGKQVMGEAYSCTDCSLVLHKECAESFDSTNTWGNPSPDFKNQFWYRFPETSPCASCKKEGQIFSPNCRSCLFETHVKCRLIPTIIRHDCEEHFLSIVLTPLSAYTESYKCAACGESGRYNFYLCKICDRAYHYRCLTDLPRRVEHEHGGHHHHMMLKFASEEAEDYICQVCYEKGDQGRRDPMLWFYSCEECPYEAHLFCTYAQ